MQLGSHPLEIRLEREAFCFAAAFWAGAHLSEFPKGSGVGDGKIERAISTLKLVLEDSRGLVVKLGVSRHHRDHDCL